MVMDGLDIWKPCQVSGTEVLPTSGFVRGRNMNDARLPHSIASILRVVSLFIMFIGLRRVQ